MKIFLRVLFDERIAQVASTTVSLAQFVQRLPLKAKLHTPHRLHLVPSIGKPFGLLTRANYDIIELSVSQPRSAAL